jgi:hypothetical protein
MAIPSQARKREGVETRRAAPKAQGQGEGIVQTPNRSGVSQAPRRAAKAVAGTKIRWAQAHAGSIPAARTKLIRPQQKDHPAYRPIMT